MAKRRKFEFAWETFGFGRRECSLIMTKYVALVQSLQTWNYPLGGVASLSA